MDTLYNRVTSARRPPARYDRWLLPLLWTGLIALFSSSTLNSEATGTLLHTIFPWMPPSALQSLNWIMRKGAHVTEYAVLTALWDRAFRQGTSWPGRWVLGVVFLLSLGTASLDELHQASVPDRTGSPIDVLLDGVASGVTLWGLSRRARGGSFLWSVTGLLVWTGFPLGVLLVALHWSLDLPTGGLFLASALACAVLLIRRSRRSALTRPNRSASIH